MGRVNVDNGGGGSSVPSDMHRVYTKAIPVSNVMRDSDMLLPNISEEVKIVFGNGVYVAGIRNSSTGWVSPDAKVWTPVTFPFPIETWQGPSFDARTGAFYVLSITSNYIAKSTNGVSWTQISTPNLSGGLEYRGGPMVVGDYLVVWNRYYGSPHATNDGGLTWSAVAIWAGTNNNLENMVYAGGRYYAAMGSGGVLSGPSLSGLSPVSTVRCEGVVTNGDWVITFSNYISNQTTKLFYRAVAGGTSFVPVTANIPNADNWYSGVYDTTLKKFIMGGKNYCVSSTDGASWTEVPGWLSGQPYQVLLSFCNKFTYPTKTGDNKIKIVETVYDQQLFFVDSENIVRPI